MSQENLKPKLTLKVSSCRIYHEGWVEKRKRNMFKTWKKRWLVLQADGVLKAFLERHDENPTATYIVGPESTISRDGDTFRFTWGEKKTGTFKERVFRPYLTLDIDEKNENTKNPKTERWFRMLKEIALRKRLQYVLMDRGQPVEEWFMSPRESARCSEDWKKLTNKQDKLLNDKFHQDKKQLWSNALRRTGDKVYFEFAKHNVGILWKMYSEGKSQISKNEIKLLLFDAFVVARDKSAHRSTPLSLVDETTYAAKIYLDKDLDGKVVFEEFQRVNTKDFWLAIDFLTPVDSEEATVKLWISIFDSLEKHGKLRPEIIYRAFERYDSKDEGFLYEADLEEFLLDYMRSALIKWPTLDTSKLDEFCKTIVIRGAIALKYLDVDQKGCVSREHFDAVGTPDFWRHVEYIVSLDSAATSPKTWERQLGYDLDAEYDFKNEKNDEANLIVSEMIDNHYNIYTDYAVANPSTGRSEKVIARPSFNIDKYCCASRRSKAVECQLNSTKPKSGNISLPEQLLMASTPGYSEKQIDPRLLQMTGTNSGSPVEYESLGDNLSSSVFQESATDEKDADDLLVFTLELEDHGKADGESVV